MKRRPTIALSRKSSFWRTYSKCASVGSRGFLMNLLERNFRLSTILFSSQFDFSAHAMSWCVCFSCLFLTATTAATSPFPLSQFSSCCFETLLCSTGPTHLLFHRPGLCPNIAGCCSENRYCNNGPTNLLLHRPGHYSNLPIATPILFVVAIVQPSCCFVGSHPLPSSSVIAPSDMFVYAVPCFSFRRGPL